MCLPLTTCCCCLSLEAGTKAISIFSIVQSLLALLLYGGGALLPVEAARRAMYTVVTSGALLHLLVGSALVYGAFRKKPSYLTPWVITACLSGAALAGLAVLGAALLLLGARPADEISTMVSVYFLEGVVQCYFSAVVSCRRQEMLREDSTESAERLMRRYQAARKYAV